MGITAQKLEQELAAFDGKAISLLTELKASFGRRDDYLSSLAGLMKNRHGHVADGATWLIKDALEEGARLSPSQTSVFTKNLPYLKDWASLLHACQSIRYLDLSEDEAAGMNFWLKPLLVHKRPFIRAWSLDAMCRIGVSHNRFRKEAVNALAAAQRAAAASVRARARKLTNLLAV